VRGFDKLGLQLAGKEALVDVVQDLVHQLGHDEALPGQGVRNAQLRDQEHPACTPLHSSILFTDEWWKRASEDIHNMT